VTLDVRTPTGILFLIVGVLLAGFGVTGDSEMYQRSLGINVNLYWGVAMTLFGAAMLAWQRLSSK
jgi:hypothetical protein